MQAQVVSVDILIELLKRQFPRFDEGGSWFYDSCYLVWTKDDVVDCWNAWRKYYEEELLKYLPEAFDCDDFAEQFKCVARRALLKKYRVYAGGLAPGVAIGRLYKDEAFLGYHAWNLILLNLYGDNYALVNFEPQTLDTWIGFIGPDKFRYELRWVVW